MAAVIETAAPAHPALFERSSLTRSTLEVAAILLGGMAAGYGVQIVLARWMGAAQYGTYANAIALASLLAVVAALGLPTVVLRFVPQYLVEERFGLLRGITRRSFQSVVVSGAALALATDLMLPLTGYAGADNIAAFRIAAWTIPLFALMQLSMDSLRARGSAKPAYLTGNLMRPVAVFVVAAAIMGLAGRLNAARACAATIAALIAVVGVQVTCIVARFPGPSNSHTPRYEYGVWARVAAPMLGTGLLMAALDASDILVLGAMTTAANVGIYSAALRTSRLINFVLGATVAHAAPMFVSLHARGDKAGLQQSLSAISHLVFWPALLLAVPMLLWPGSILGIFGSNFAAGRWVLVALVIGQLVNVGAGPVYYLLQMTGYHDDVLYLMGFMELLQVALEIIFVRLWGVTGAAIATAASVIAANVFMHSLAVRRLGVRCSIVSGIRSYFRYPVMKGGLE